MVDIKDAGLEHVGPYGFGFSFVWDEKSLEGFKQAHGVTCMVKDLPGCSVESRFGKSGRVDASGQSEAMLVILFQLFTSYPMTFSGFSDPES